MKRSIRIYLLSIPLILIVLPLRAGTEAILSEVSARLSSNGVNDILVAGDTVWVGSGEGLSYTTDGGESWFQYSREDGFGKGGVSAIAKRGALIWAATAFDTLTKDSGELPAGGGLSYSTDRGETWRWMKQPKDSKDVTAYKPTTTHVQNLTYDMAISRDYVWIASFGGGLRRSRIGDIGSVWEVVTVDGLPFSSLDYLSHRAFSVLYDGKTIWVGTAGGVHKSTDEGERWTTFNHQNQPEGISGNFVVALGSQKTSSREILWAATVEALGEGETRAVSKTEDGGLSWKIVLNGVFAHNFAFDDSIAYVATDQGLFKSIDRGETWAVFPQYLDESSTRRMYATEVNTAATDTETGLWVGTSDGLAYSADGWQWRVFQAYQTPGENGTPETYAFPNPFSPMRHNVEGDEGHVRFQYRMRQAGVVTVRIYDFAMKRVRNLVEQKSRPVGDFAEVWDGRNDFGDMAANGVYFYRIDIAGREPLWGKVMVVN